jgi:hypothetical protein
LGKVLTTTQSKFKAFYEMDTCALGLDWSFGTTYEKTRRKEAIWQTEARMGV